MNKLFLTVFVISFAIIAAAPSQEEKNQGNLGSKSAQIYCVKVQIFREGHKI